jgi:hypothetical protein
MVQVVRIANKITLEFKEKLHLNLEKSCNSLY